MGEDLPTTSERRVRRSIELAIFSPNMSTFSNLQRLVQRILSYDSAVCEEKKTIINTTFYCALWRGSVHLLPILVSATLIVMNTIHVYIGPDLVFHSLTTTNSLAAFQIAAKIQVRNIYHTTRQERLTRLFRRCWQSQA